MISAPWIKDKAESTGCRAADCCNGRFRGQMIYLDNAATSHPKPETVYQAVESTLRRGGSPGRGHYSQALAAERLVFETRELLGQLLQARDTENFVFTPNATAALNQALFGLLQPGDRVVTSSMEHNAVTRPLRALQDRGVEVVKVAADCHSGEVAVADLQDQCQQKTTRLMVLSHCSNVTGTIQAIEELGPWCRRQGILLLVDAAQSAGALPITIDDWQIDLLAAPGHKGLLGPQGTGFLYVRPGLELQPRIFGGTGTDSASDRQPDGLPTCLESGTLNLPGIAGLNAALHFILATGVVKIHNREQELGGLLVNGLRKIPALRIYGPSQPARRSAVFSLQVADRDPAELAFLLERDYSIATRIGLHCAPDAHRTIGTFPVGTLRVSPGYFTTEQEIEAFCSALATLCERG